jgi:N-acetylneuraminic acid mutarotase
MKTKLLLSAIFLTMVLVSYGQWSYTNLSEPKDRIGTAVLGSKAYFGGGEDNNGDPVSTVEIYDIKKEGWDPMISFQVPRMHPAGVACDTKIIFAGGGNINTMASFNEVDIWDTATKQWTYEHLLEPRVFLSAVSKGNIVLFAGGTNFGNATDLVEILDVSDNTWTYASLTEPRSSMGAAVTGDLAFFAGGYKDVQQQVSDIVDIYNFNTKTWSTAVLSQARAFLTAVALGDIVMFAGGTDANNQASDRVDIYHRSTGEWTTDMLSVPRALFPEPLSAAVCSKAYYVGGGHMDLYTHTISSDLKTIDIYDVNTQTWSVDSMSEVKILHAVAGVDDHLMIAGGYYSDELSEVEIFIDPDCVHPGIDPLYKEITDISVYPNPCSGILHFDLSNDNVNKQLLVAVYDLQGRAVFNQILHSSERKLNLNLPSGMYVLRVIVEDGVYSELITIQ